MEYGVFSDEGLIEGGFYSIKEADEAAGRYQQEYRESGYDPSVIHRGTVCSECGGDSDCCDCGQEEE